MLCAKTVFSSYPTGSLFLWHLLLGLAKTNYVRRCCFSQVCLYNGRCFPVRLLAVITRCVSHTVCVPVCIHMRPAFLRMVSVPQDIWFPPVKRSGRGRSLEVKNPTANFISHSWWTPRTILLFCRQAVHTANIPFPLCAAAEKSIAAPRRSCSTSLLCILQKKQLLKPMTMKLLSFPAFSSSPFVYMTLKAHNGVLRARADSRDHCLLPRDLVRSFRGDTFPFSLLKAAEPLTPHPTQEGASAFVCQWKQKCRLLSCWGASAGNAAVVKQRGIASVWLRFVTRYFPNVIEKAS